MALSSLRLRRALALSASLLKHRPFSAAAITASPPLPPLAPLSDPALRPPCATQRLSFQTSAPLWDRRSGGGDDGKIDPDEILFEGCDYNHWLITMDFPKDPKPTPEEMVETYVQTLAKVVGSVEEAKKRMYACSTTTYTGFQAVMTEEMSEKFRGLPGVVFILPDSYIDPVNKEYGGDKYENGVITPRPPPVQYGRQGRYGDRNRNYDRPRYDRQRDTMPMRQGNPSFDRQGSPQGEGRNFAQQQNYGQVRQGYGPPGGGNFAPERRDYQPGVNLGRDGNFPPQEHRDFSQGQQGNFPPHEPRNFPQGQQVSGRSDYRQGMGSNYGGAYQQDGNIAPERRDYQPGVNLGWDGNSSPQEHRDFSQGQQGNFPPHEPRNFPQGQQVSGSSDYRQGMSSNYDGVYQQDGSAYGQNYTGSSGQGMNSNYGGAYRQDDSASGQNYTGSSGQTYGQNYSGPQPPPHIDHRDSTQSEQRNFAYPPQTGTNQGQY